MSKIVMRIVTIVILALAALRLEAAPITVLTRDGGPIASPARAHGAEFLQATGQPVTVETRPFDALYGEIMMGFVTGQTPADVLLFPADWLPDFAPYLQPVPARLVQSPLVQGIHPAYRDRQMRWRGQWMAVSLDGDLHMGAYRRDLFEDPATRTAFKAATGMALAPPATWADYAKIAAFFHGRKDPAGQPLAGTLEASAPDGQRLWSLFSHAAAYTAHPDYPGYFFFDPETMAPEIDNPAWLRALNDYLAAVASGVDETGPLSSHGVRSAFAAGRSAMALDWSDIGVLATDATAFTTGDRVGFFALPGVDDVWNPETKAWDKLAAPRAVPFLAFGGWIAAVPREAVQPAEAWDFIAFMAAPDRAARDVMSGASGFNPYRRAQLEDRTGWAALMGAAPAASYLDVLHQSLDAPQAAQDLRLPGYPAYMAALEARIGKVLAKEMTPEAALQAAAADWDRITDRLGRASQRRHYREAMGLEAASQ
ncbi:ABC transporter substrate-binding protein [Rhodobacter maris]|uniref:Carbohydrate ABC transporter substrate-binding protein (CUT1 family) n=1 Tax=Rhodobacter maris TaxID=446682 RepID=A0A285T1W0_9RHOB|nr:extracellular solute-binding protein [Rhodobacter maris]SOC15302.1 carbohydrate ABC transporter substrate-binding protein (CUT1 family) [Rhodobacter maris]